MAKRTFSNKTKRAHCQYIYTTGKAKGKKQSKNKPFKQNPEAQKRVRNGQCVGKYNQTVFCLSV